MGLLPKFIVILEEATAAWLLVSPKHSGAAGCKSGCSVTTRRLLTVNRGSMSSEPGLAEGQAIEAEGELGRCVLLMEVSSPQPPRIPSLVPFHMKIKSNLYSRPRAPAGLWALQTSYEVSIVFP